MMHHIDTDPRYQAYINDGSGFFSIGTASRVPRLLDATAKAPSAT